MCKRMTVHQYTQEPMCGCIGVGQQATWLRSTARGYGFEEKIPVRVVSFNKNTVKVEAPLANGGTTLVNVR
jgi:hypothetical protein